jgi:methylamine dehydrogenase light chain
MKWFDTLTEASTRSMARRTSRRSLLASLGAVLMGASALPLLPVARGAAAAESKGTDEKPGANDDPSSCDYWRHCAIDGFLCNCCGGSQSACPPGTEMSLVTWVGTCHNPADGKDYAISYNDCCGKSSCGRCLCNRNERDTPLYIPFQSNDYNWCSGSSKANIPYHCSTARIVGEAK